MVRFDRITPFLEWPILLVMKGVKLDNPPIFKIYLQELLCFLARIVGLIFVFKFLSRLQENTFQICENTDIDQSLCIGGRFHPGKEIVHKSSFDEMKNLRRYEGVISIRLKMKFCYIGLDKGHCYPKFFRAKIYGLFPA